MPSDKSIFILCGDAGEEPLIPSYTFSPEVGEFFGIGNWLSKFLINFCECRINNHLRHKVMNITEQSINEYQYGVKQCYFIGFPPGTKKCPTIFRRPSGGISPRN